MFLPTGLPARLSSHFRTLPIAAHAATVRRCWLNAGFNFSEVSAMTVNYIPPGYQHVTPYLTVNRAADAIRFYQEAFGATEVMRFEHDGILGHAEIQIADCRIMLGEEMPEWGNKSPTTLGGSPGGLHVYVKDVDRAFAQALKAGAKEEQPLTDQFYGDRSGSLVDPFGHRWTLATHKEDVPEGELQRRFHEFMAQMRNAPESGTARATQHAGA